MESERKKKKKEAQLQYIDDFVKNKNKKLK
jgi:hypothetical protein